MSRTMIITGTSRGLGRAAAEYYLAAGWRVAGCSRAVASIEHPDYRHFQFDVGDEPAVVAMVRETVRRNGGVDALINNAGIAAMNHALLTTRASLETILRTNVVGTFLFSREVAKVMLSRRYGRIVNFATVATPLHLEGEAAYAASKAAVESFTVVLARELGPAGITVNAVGPTPVPTDLIKNVPKEKLKALQARQAIPRSGTPDDVLNVIDFFLSERSAFVTGQVVYLGGVAR
jgi:3-oxoacyl-[acyl-carrier protein] reductase